MRLDDEEMWRVVRGYPDYEVSDRGRIRHRGDGSLVRATTHKETGEPWVTVEYFESSFRGPVWMLMLKAFYEYTGSMRDVLPTYRDDDPKNLSVYNIFWNTPRGFPLLFTRSDDGSWRRHYKKGRRVEILETGEQFEGVRECAASIGGTTNAIYMCLRGVSKTHKGYTYRFID